MSGGNRRQNKRNKSKVIKYVVSIGLLLLFLWMTVRFFDPKYLHQIFKNFKQQPILYVLMTFVYASAFILRASAWYIYEKRRISFKACLDGIWYSLFINHISPFKVGDVARISIGAQSKKTTLEKVTNSVVILRMLDIVILVGLSGLGFLVFLDELPIRITSQDIVLVLLSGSLVVLLLTKLKVFSLKSHFSFMIDGLNGRRGIFIVFLVFSSWICEAIVVYLLAKAFYPVEFIKAIWVNSIAVGGGVFQVTPGGAGTYESMMSGALVSLNVSFKDAYHIALLSHLYKYLFSFVIGIYLLLRRPFPISFNQLYRKKGGES